MNPLEIVKSADAILAHPENWIKESLAVNKTGNHVKAGSADACAFCILGAILNTDDSIKPADIECSVIRKLETPSSFSKGYLGVMAFNDDKETTFEDVKEMFRRTIEKLETEVKHGVFLRGATRRER